jgi:arylsulfatase A
MNKLLIEHFRKINMMSQLTKPHPQPLSDGEGGKKRPNAPLYIGEGLGVRFCENKSITIICIILFYCLSPLSVSSQTIPTKTKPNIIFILTDDMGYEDLGCYGNPYNETPHIDSLAKRGLRFTQAYSASPVCSPSRASLLTGKNPARLRLTNFMGGERKDTTSNVNPPPNWVRSLPNSEVTIAEKLKEKGYATGMIGKWHVGGSPWEQGFDFARLIGKNDLDYYNYGIYEDSNKKMFKDDGKTYLTDKLTDYALEFINKEGNKNPFFLYLAYSAPHVLTVPRADKLSKYFWKYEKFGGKYNPNYAAMIESVDDGVGAIMKSLKEKGLLENTIVIFTSDNGGLAIPELGPQPTMIQNLKKWKGFVYEGGIRIPMIINWQGKITNSRVVDNQVVNTDYYNTFLEIIGEKSIETLDSKSFLSVLNNTSTYTERSEIVWHYPHFSNQTSRPAGAIRQGDWKLTKSYETQKCELYNIKNDEAETKDLSKKNKAKTKELNELLMKKLSEMNAQMPVLKVKK